MTATLGFRLLIVAAAVFVMNAQTDVATASQLASGEDRILNVADGSKVGDTLRAQAQLAPLPSDYEGVAADTAPTSRFSNAGVSGNTESRHLGSQSASRGSAVAECSNQTIVSCCHIATSGESRHLDAEESTVS